MCLIRLIDRFDLQEKDPRNFIGWRFFTKSSYNENRLSSLFYRSHFTRGKRSFDIAGYTIDTPLFSYPGGYHIFPTKHEAMLALKISPEFHLYWPNLFISRVSFSDVRTYGIDVCGVRCVVAGELTPLTVQDIPATTKVVRFDRGISEISIGYDWRLKVTEPITQGRPPLSTVTVEEVLLARRHKEGHYVFNPKHLLPIRDIH